MRLTMRGIFLGLTLTCCAAGASAQEAAKTQGSAGSASAAQKPDAPQAVAPAANPADVASPEAILAATYDVISGPAGQKRDWDRFRSLFVPDARLMAVGPEKDGILSLHGVSPDGYSQRADAYFMKNGFAERSISNTSERYGNIMQIFSTYESRHDPKDAAPFARGINSFQLFYDGKRWWIVTIYWEEETPANPIPKEYLPAK